jgi:hypothetical protein
MGAPEVPELCVTALEPSPDDVEQAVYASDVVEEVVVRGVRLQEVVFKYLWLRGRAAGATCGCGRGGIGACTRRGNKSFER